MIYCSFTLHERQGCFQCDILYIKQDIFSYRVEGAFFVLEILACLRKKDNLRYRAMMENMVFFRLKLSNQ